MTFASQHQRQAKREAQKYDAIASIADEMKAEGRVWYGNASQPGEARHVNLAERTCSCGEWRDMGLPCHHAYALANACEEKGYQLSRDAARWLDNGCDRVYRQA